MMNKLLLSRSLASLLVTLALLSSTAGCAEPMRYRYISLKDVTGIETTKEEEPELKHFHLLEGAFPTGYTLKQPAYQLAFRVDTERFAPHIWIKATTGAGAPLFLKPRSDRLPKSERARPCGTYSTSQPTDERRFDWVICGTDAAPEEMKIAFDVVDADGSVLGEEALPFKLEANGFYFPPDGP